MMQNHALGMDDTSSCSPSQPQGRCNHPGRRIIGRRIYDSVLGVTCHWCRQKTVEDHVFCCLCTITFCGRCLRNRHGEDVEVEMKDDVDWTCPKCRGGCGPGCNNCCNCGPCRKAQGMEPTGLLVRTARSCSFSNVHDYLIHEKTGECEDIIEKRKQGQGWCRTDPALFQEKRKRMEYADGNQATCTIKQSNFRQSEDKKHRSSPQANSLEMKGVVNTATTSYVSKLDDNVQASKKNKKRDALSRRLKEAARLKEVANTAAVYASELDHNCQAIKTQREENGSLLKLKDAVRRHGMLLLKSSKDNHTQGNVPVRMAPTSENAVLMQPKPEPESFDSRNNAIATSCALAEASHVNLQACDLIAKEGEPQPRHLATSDSLTQANSGVCLSNWKSVLEKECLQFENGAFNSLPKVKTEQLDLCHESSAIIEQWNTVGKATEKRKDFVYHTEHVNSGMQEQASHQNFVAAVKLERVEDVHQPVQEGNEGSPKLMTVKAEICEPGLRYHDEPIFQGHPSNIPCDVFGLAFAIPSQRVEPLPSTLPKICETCGTGEAWFQRHQRNSYCCPAGVDFTDSFETLESCSQKLSSSVPQFDETHRDRDVAEQKRCNFHLLPNYNNFELYPRTNFCLYPQSFPSMPLHGTKTLGEQNVNARTCRAKLEVASCQGTQGDKLFFEEQEKT